MKKIILILALIAICLPSFAARIPPSEWSLRGLASWSQPLTASGAALPGLASFIPGDLFMTYGTGMASPTLYRLASGAASITWEVVGDGGSAGVTDHSALSELDFASSGHTGFEVEGAAASVSASVLAVVGVSSPDLPAFSGRHPGLLDSAGDTWTAATGTELAACVPIVVDGSGNCVTYDIISGDILSSADYGENWTIATGSALQLWGGTYCGNGVFVLVGDDGVSQGVVVRSLDHGATWEDPIEATGTASLTTSEYCGGGVLVMGDLTTNEIYRSINFGATWAVASDTGQDPTDFAYAGKGVVLCANGTRILRSADAGATWSVATDTTDIAMQFVLYLGRGRVVAGGTKVGAQVYLIRSVDHGATWVQISALSETADGWGIRGGTALGDGAGLVLDGDAASIWRTADYGETWDKTPAHGLSGINTVRHAGDGIILLSPDEIYRSTDAK